MVISLPAKLLKIVLSVFIGLIIFFLIQNIPTTRSAEEAQAVYSDGLAANWSNWSWGASINFDNPSPNFSGSKSIWAKLDSWGALYLHSGSPVDVTFLKNISFAIQSQSVSQKFQLLIYDNSNQPVKSLPLSNYGGDPSTDNYTLYNIPLSDLGITSLSGIAIQEASGRNADPIFVDSIEFSVNTNIVSQTSNLPASTVTQPASTSNHTVYADSLSGGYSNWSWGGSVDFSSDDFFQGSKAMIFNTNSSWAGLYLHSDNPFLTSKYNYLNFAVKTQDANQPLKVVLYDENNYPLGEFKQISAWAGNLDKGVWTPVSIPLAELNAAAGKSIKGIAIQEASGNGNKYFFVDEIRFTSEKLNALKLTPTTVPIVNNLVSPTLAPTVTPVPVVNAAPVITSGSGYTTGGGNVYKDGKKIVLKGINWFGFETDTLAPHGLWQRGYKEMISQVKNLGFNSVRIPVCPRTLTNTATTSIDYSQNPDLKGLTSVEVLDKIVAEMDRQGIYVLLDHHRPDCNAISELWYKDSYTEANWITDLTYMATRYQGVGNFIGIDLKNEPHGSATWGTGNVATDWNLAAERAGKKVHEANPNILIFVEGIGDNSVCSSSGGHGWGSNLEMVNCNPIASSMVPSEKIVYSPHMYGPDVYFQSYFSDPNFPANMPAVWDKFFGYLKDKGYTIAIGEWGSKYGLGGGNSLDVKNTDAFVNYLSQKGICNSYYWSLNPNSGDTGGILKDDWTSVWPEKMAFMNKYFSACSN